MGCLSLARPVCRVCVCVVCVWKGGRVCGQSELGGVGVSVSEVDGVDGGGLAVWLLLFSKITRPPRRPGLRPTCPCGRKPLWAPSGQPSAASSRGGGQRPAAAASKRRKWASARTAHCPMGVFCVSVQSGTAHHNEIEARRLSKPGSALRPKWFDPGSSPAGLQWLAQARKGAKPSSIRRAIDLWIDRSLRQRRGSVVC